jgi:hypothetical protein
MTAISRHFKEAVEYDKGLGMKTSQKSLKQPNMGDYYTYNGERDNVDYDWEKNESIIRRAILESIDELDLGNDIPVGSNVPCQARHLATPLGSGPKTYSWGQAPRLSLKGQV